LEFNESVGENLCGWIECLDDFLIQAIFCKVVFKRAKYSDPRLGVRLRYSNEFVSTHLRQRMK